MSIDGVFYVSQSDPSLGDVQDVPLDGVAPLETSPGVWELLDGPARVYQRQTGARSSQRIAYRSEHAASATLLLMVNGGFQRGFGWRYGA